MSIDFVYNGKLKPKAREFRKTKNLPEIIMWRQLQNKKFLGLQFDKQKVIGNFIADFCCESKKIIIEVDGESHANREEYDAERDAYLQGASFTVLRVSTADVKYNMDGVLCWLQSQIETLSKRK